MVDLVWPFAPNWSAEVRETLEWLTSVPVSPAAVEQRMRLRRSPRRTLEYEVLANHADRQLLHWMLVEHSSKRWLHPLWFDQVVASAPWASGTTEILFATALREFTAGGKALLIGDDPRSYEVVEIDTVTSDRITLVDATAATWPAGTRLYPLRLAELASAPNLAKKTDRLWSSVVAFSHREPDDYSASHISLATYRGLPVLQTAPNDREDLATVISRVTTNLDTVLAYPTMFDTAGAALRTQAHSWLVAGLSQHAEFRSFLYTAQGRWKAFWLPTFMDDFTLAVPISSADTTIDVVNSGYADLIDGAMDNAKDIRILKTDGTSILRRVTAASEISSSIERLALDSAVGANLALVDVERIELMSMARLDVDRVEIVHTTDRTGVASSNLVMKSHLSGRAANPWTPQAPPNATPGDTNTPPVPAGSSNMIARVFTSTSFDTQYGSQLYPLSVDGNSYAASEPDITFATGAELVYEGSGAVFSLFLELIATDDLLSPLPADEQPASWAIESAHATVAGPVDKNTFVLYSPVADPVYGGVRLEFDLTNPW